MQQTSRRLGNTLVLGCMALCVGSLLSAGFLVCPCGVCKKARVRGAAYPRRWQIPACLRHGRHQPARPCAWRVRLAWQVVASWHAWRAMTSMALPGHAWRVGCLAPKGDGPAKCPFVTWGSGLEAPFNLRGCSLGLLEQPSRGFGAPGRPLSRSGAAAALTSHANGGRLASLRAGGRAVGRWRVLQAPRGFVGTARVQAAQHMAACQLLARL